MLRGDVSQHGWAGPPDGTPHVQRVNCTVSDLVTSSPVYNDLSPSGIVSKIKGPTAHKKAKH